MKKLKICFTSDLHGYFYPTSYGDHMEKEMGLFRCMEGFQKDEDTLIIDGGDILQGSAFAYYCANILKNSKPIAEVMNSCGYDFITIGNHDFNYGLNYLKEYVTNLNAACLCENVKDEEGNVLFPYAIKEMQNGLKVGLIGIVTDYVNVWEKPANIEKIKITDPFEAARLAIASCREEVDVLVGIYHGGFERNLETEKLLTESKENIAYKICEKLDFDLLLTGHQHMSIDGQYIHGTYVVQSCEYGREFQKIEVLFESGRKMITSKRMKAKYKVDHQLAEKFAIMEKKVQEWLNRPIGSLSKPLYPTDKVTMAYYGSPIADFINEIQLYFSGAQISCVGLANEIAGFNKEVTTRDIIASYPYPNTLVVLEILGEDLLKAMERSAEYFTIKEDGEIGISEAFLVPKQEHYNYDYYAGVSYQIDVTKPIGSRIENVLLDGENIDPKKKYTICMNNYRSSGAGGYEMYLKCKVIKEINREMVELIIEYFQHHQHIVINSNKD